MERLEVDTVRLWYKMDGTKVPRALKYADGRVEIIDYIIEEKLSAAKTGGRGMRYTCLIEGKTSICFTTPTGVGSWKNNW